MSTKKDKKTKSQWYSSDELDTDVDFQNWDTHNHVSSPNYTKAYDKMMDEVANNTKKEE